MSQNFAFLDEHSKKEIRRQTLKAIAIPGYQVPFASRELPIARGWGTGGLQLTLSLVGQEDGGGQGFRSLRLPPDCR